MRMVLFDIPYTIRKPTESGASMLRSTELGRVPVAQPHGEARVGLYLPTRVHIHPADSESNEGDAVLVTVEAPNSLTEGLADAVEAIGPNLLGGQQRE